MGAAALAPDRVNVCGELVKAGNASPCYIEPLDWSIIILGTHPFPFLPVCLTPASPPLPRPPSLRGSLHLRVIVAVMTYLALSSAPGSTNTHADRRTPGTRTHTTGCERTHAEHTSFPPPHVVIWSKESANRCVFAISNVYMNTLKRMQKDCIINGVQGTCASRHANCCFPFLVKEFINLPSIRVNSINRFGDTEGASCAPKALIWTSTRGPCGCTPS